MDEIVSAVQYRNYILIFMKTGKIYKMEIDENNNQPFYMLIDRF